LTLSRAKMCRRGDLLRKIADPQPMTSDGLPRVALGSLPRSISLAAPSSTAQRASITNIIKNATVKGQTVSGKLELAPCSGYQHAGFILRKIHSLHLGKDTFRPRNSRLPTIRSRSLSPISSCPHLISSLASCAIFSMPSCPGYRSSSQCRGHCRLQVETKVSVILCTKTRTQSTYTCSPAVHRSRPAWRRKPSWCRGRMGRSDRMELGMGPEEPRPRPMQ
jgi:hypothetical protein